MAANIELAVSDGVRLSKDIIVLLGQGSKCMREHQSTPLRCFGLLRITMSCCFTCLHTCINSSNNTPPKRLSGLYKGAIFNAKLPHIKQIIMIQ